MTDSDPLLASSPQATPKLNPSPNRRKVRAIADEQKPLLDESTQTVQMQVVEAKRKDTWTFDGCGIDRDEIRRLEEGLDEKELSLRTMMARGKGSLEDCLSEYQIYISYLTEIACRIKRKDSRLASTMARGLEGCRKTFDRIIEIQVGEVTVPRKSLSPTIRRQTAPDGPVQGKETCSQTSAVDMLEKVAASPELYQTSEALRRLKKLKYSDMYSTLEDLYASLKSIKAEDIPEASETPETWEPEEYHQELQTNMREMHRLITQKVAKRVLNPTVFSQSTQTDADFSDPLIRVLENQLRDKTIEANRYLNDLNMVKMLLKQESELLSRTRDHLREIEERNTKFDLELHALRRKEANLSSNLTDMKTNQQMSDDYLIDLIKGQNRLKLMLYKTDARARKAEKMSLGNERMSKEMVVLKEAKERQIESVKNREAGTETEIEVAAKKKLKDLEDIYTQKAIELEQQQDQQTEELTQVIAGLEAMLTELQNLQKTGSPERSQLTDGHLGSNAKDASYLRPNPAHQPTLHDSEDEGGKTEGRRVKHSMANGSSDPREEYQGLDHSDSSSRQNSPSSQWLPGDSGLLRKKGKNPGRIAKSDRLRQLKTGRNVLGDDSSEATENAWLKKDASRSPSKRRESVDKRAPGKVGNVDLSGLDQADVELLQMIFDMPDLALVDPVDLAEAVADFDAFLQLPEADKQVYLRVRDTIRRQIQKPAKVSLADVDPKDAEFVQMIVGTRSLNLVDPEYLSELVQDLEYFKSLPETEQAVYIKVRDTMRKLMRKNKGYQQDGKAEENETVLKLPQDLRNGKIEGFKGSNARNGNIYETYDPNFLSHPSTDLDRNPELILDSAPGHNFFIPGLSREEQLKYESYLRRIMQGHDRRCGSQCQHLRRAFLFKKKMHGKLFPMKVLNLMYKD